MQKNFCSSLGRSGGGLGNTPPLEYVEVGNTPPLANTPLPPPLSGAPCLPVLTLTTLIIDRSGRNF